MTTVLQYLVIAAVIGLVVFGITLVVFGRGEQMAPLSPRTSPTELPDEGLTGDDVRSIRFAMALRGYRMSDVDWALERMAGELDRLTALLAAVSGESERPESSSDEARVDALAAESGAARQSTPDFSTGAERQSVADSTNVFTRGGARS